MGIVSIPAIIAISSASRAAGPGMKGVVFSENSLSYRSVVECPGIDVVVIQSRPRSALAHRSSSREFENVVINLNCP